MTLHSVFGFWPLGQVLIKSCHLIELVVSSLWSVVSAQAISY
jgi:hypothetical protein